MEQAHIHTKYKLLHESALLLKHFMIRYVITCLTDGHYTPQHQQKRLEVDVLSKSTMVGKKLN